MHMCGIHPHTHTTHTHMHTHTHTHTHTHSSQMNKISSRELEKRKPSWKDLSDCLKAVDSSFQGRSPERP